MVSKSSKRRTLICVALFIVIAAGSFFSAKYLKFFEPEKHEEVIDDFSEPEEIPEKATEKLDLNPLVSEWFDNLPEDVSAGVEIYDLDNEYILAEKNSSEVFSTESIYKLFVVYYGYEELAESNIEIGSTLSNGKTIGSCLDLAIRESNSPCGESLREYLGAEKIEEALTSRYGMENTSVVGLKSTPSDLIKMLSYVKN